MKKNLNICKHCRKRGVKF